MAQKPAAGFTQPKQAFDRDGACVIAVGRGGGRRAEPLCALVLRHKATVDQHLVAIGQLQRGHHPIAGPQLRAGLRQYSFLGQPHPLKAHGSVFVTRCIHCRPLRFGWQRRGGRGEALRDTFDEVQLPGQTLHLPHTQCDERHKKGDAHQGEHRQR